MYAERFIYVNQPLLPLCRIYGYAAPAQLFRHMFFNGIGARLWIGVEYRQSLGG